MNRYSKQTRLLIAVDCIILIKRSFEPEKGKWSLMGGFVKPEESLKECADRVLKQLTGIEGVYLEQLRTFSKPDRDPVERTVSVAYFALIDINQYEKQISHDYNAEWFLLNEKPALIFDHDEMVALAQRQLRYKASLHPVLFELLPEKFTIPQLQELYQGVYDTSFDNRNFSRKILSTGLLVKQKEKDKTNSKKGAFYYKLDKKKYKANFQAFLNFIPNPDKFII